MAVLIVAPAVLLPAVVALALEQCWRLCWQQLLLPMLLPMLLPTAKQQGLELGRFETEPMGCLMLMPLVVEPLKVVLSS